MAGSFIFSEALVLGLASGPACVASCGPVVVPSLLSEQSGLRPNVHYLSFFLGARLLGYLLFAAVAWELGELVSLSPGTRPLTVGTIHVVLALLLVWYAYSARPACAQSCSVSELVTIGPAGKRVVPGAAALGFITGVSICPPFAAAGVRAAELSSVTAALFFFAVFFVGTSVWFLPFLTLACVRRNEAVTTVARMATVLVAIYYAFLGLMMLVGGKAHGY